METNPTSTDLLEDHRHLPTYLSQKIALIICGPVVLPVFVVPIVIVIQQVTQNIAARVEPAQTLKCFDDIDEFGFTYCSSAKSP